jgi:S1-C subfamily serine protease
MATEEPDGRTDSPFAGEPAPASPASELTPTDPPLAEPDGKVAPEDPAPGVYDEQLAADPTPPDVPVPPVPPVGGSAWSEPGTDATAPMPTTPLSELPPAPSSWPAPPEPPAEATPPKAPSTRRAALMGALAGAVVAALVATGVTVALDDDDSSSGGSAAVATPITTGEGALDIQAILDKVQPSVVAIETAQTTSRGVFEGAGSGIVLTADGLVVTNAHVIGNLGEITVVLSDGTEHPAELVGASPDDDIAVIRVQGVDDLVPADLGSSDALRVGDEVIAIGNALNLGGEPTVTRGIVSAQDRDLDAEGVSLQGLIQTDAAINPGNSGGPLVNAAGQVVGMNTAIVADAQNLGFSIAIDLARPIIAELEEGRGAVTPGQAFLGVSSADIADLSDALLEQHGIEEESGAVVTEVVPGSAADEGGLEIGDVIVAIDGEAVETSTDVRDQVLAHEPGDDVEVRVLRQGEEEVLTVTLGRRGDDT